MHSRSPRLLAVLALLGCILALPMGRAGVAEGSSQKAGVGQRAKSTPKAERLDLRDRRIAPIVLPDGQPIEAIVEIPAPDGLLTLELTRYANRAANFRVLEDRGDGELHEIEAPPVKTYRGHVVGDPESTVWATIDNGRFWATVQREGFEDLVIEPVDPLAVFRGRALPHFVFESSAVVPDGRGCGNDLFDMDPHGFGDGAPGDQGGIAGANEYLVEIGIDSDYEFFQKNGSNVANTVNDIESIMNGVNTVYRRDVGIFYEITTIIVRSGSNDGYSGTTNIETLLCEFRNRWNSAPETSIQRDMAQMFSGKSMQGSVIGLAWLGVVCNDSGSGCGSFGNLAYSVVESRYTTSYNLRVSLSAHEMGHNWNSDHCSGGTCHIMCASNNGCGGVVGSNLKFGPSSISTITSYRNQLSCDTLLPPPSDLPFVDEFLSTTVSPSRWIYRNGAISSSSSVNPPSPTRALQLDASGSGEFDDDEVRSNFIPLDGLGGETVELGYWTQHRGPEAGETLVVEYLTFFNDWVVIGEVVSDGTVQEEFVEHRHVLPQNAKHEEFRIRFRTEVNETNDDWFIDNVIVEIVPTEPPPANDECAGAIAVASGPTPYTLVGATAGEPLMPFACGNGTDYEMAADVWFAYTVPCNGLLEIDACDAAFDSYLAIYDGSAGCPTGVDAPLLCSFDFPLCGTGAKIITAAVAGQQLFLRVGTSDPNGTGEGTLVITCTGDGPACPADLNDNGEVGGEDLATMLGSWGPCVGCPADLDGNGEVGGADLAELLSSWGPCP
ncbi:MAG: M12 family metallo-peptidase [Phycisphaerales bacterium]|jgi:hypothetical protein